MPPPTLALPAPRRMPTTPSLSPSCAPSSWEPAQGRCWRPDTLPCRWGRGGRRAGGGWRRWSRAGAATAAACWQVGGNEGPLIAQGVKMTSAGLVSKASQQPGGVAASECLASPQCRRLPSLCPLPPRRRSSPAASLACPPSRPPLPSTTPPQCESVHGRGPRQLGGKGWASMPALRGSGPRCCRRAATHPRKLASSIPISTSV